MTDVEERDQERINFLRNDFDHVFTMAKQGTHYDEEYHTEAVVGRLGAKKVANKLIQRGVGEVLDQVIFEHIRTLA